MKKRKANFMVAKLGLDSPVGAGTPSLHPQLREGAHRHCLVSKHEHSADVQLAEVKASTQLTPMDI